MNSAQRVVMMAEMHGRDMVRRHVALALLMVLPLSFYLSASGSGAAAIPSGAIGMAFAVSGAALFSSLSALEVDQRLLLGGYRPIELLLGRLLFLGALGLVIATGFAALMSAVSHPATPWLLGVGVGVVALQSVPFGLAVAAVVPHELEGTLVVIGVVGIQIASHTNTVLARTLPFYGPRRLIDVAVSGHGAVPGPLLQTGLYGLALLLIARTFMAKRLSARPPEAGYGSSELGSAGTSTAH